MKKQKIKNPESDVKRILLVEDEPSLCELCRRVLTGEGFEVDIAVNGKAAQDMIEKQQYHLFLIDIRLPVMTGNELYQWLQEKHPQLVNRVIFTTGSVLGGDTQSFLRNSGRPVLIKPFIPEQLKVTIRLALKVADKWLKAKRQYW